MPRYLVTAGGTREPIDRVREIGNVFTGATGFAIARALTDVGQVTLFTSNERHAEQCRGDGPEARPFRSYQDLMAGLERAFQTQRYDGVFMTAAVADYAPRRAYAVVDRRTNPDGSEVWTVRDAQAEKVKSTHAAIAVLAEPTRKIIDLFRSPWNHRGLLVKFKLEVGIGVEALLSIAARSRLHSGADYIVANTLDMVDGAGTGAYLLGEAGHEWVARAELPARLARLAREALR